MTIKATMTDGRTVPVDMAARSIVGRTQAFALKAVSKATMALYGRATVSFEEVAS